MRIPRDSRGFGRGLLTGAVLASIPAVGLSAAHPAAATSLLQGIQSAVSCATSTACVSGTNTSSGPGVAGASKSGFGVSGTSTSNAGVHGASSTSAGVVGTTSNNATYPGGSSYGVAGYDLGPSSSLYNDGVYGKSTNGRGVYGTSSYGSGVYGDTSAGYGIFGNSVTGDGVAGSSSSSAGIYGYSGSQYGVLGSSSGSYGVVGITTEGTSAGVNGVSGVGDGGYFETQFGTTAIQAVNDNNQNRGASYAISASTGGDSLDLFNSTRAVLGTNANGDGGEFAGSYIGLIGRAPTNGFPMDLLDENYKNLFLVDGSGNATLAGNLTVNGKVHSNVRTAGGLPVSAFVPKSAAPTIEDTGTAQLNAGAAAVPLDPTFAASIDGRQSYRVFVTPDGDTNGLYVAAKTAAGFIVREIHGGRSTLAFDYRIVATAWGESGQRAAVVTESPLATARVLPATVPKPPKAARLKVPALK